MGLCILPRYCSFNRCNFCSLCIVCYSSRCCGILCYWHCLCCLTQGHSSLCCRFCCCRWRGWQCYRTVILYCCTISDQRIKFLQCIALLAHCNHVLIGSYIERFYCCFTICIQILCSHRVNTFITINCAILCRPVKPNICRQSSIPIHINYFSLHINSQIPGFSHIESESVGGHGTI